MRDKIIAALAKPIQAGEYATCDDFDPWADVIGGIYGSYSSEMDDLFIDALKAVRDRATFDFIDKEGKSGELALYVLAGHGLTDYGTSPRGGWPDSEIADLWQPLIDKWQAHRKAAWGDD